MFWKQIWGGGGLDFKSFSFESIPMPATVTEIWYGCCIHPNCHKNLAVLLCSLQLSQKSGRAVVFTPTVTEIWQCWCVHPNCHRNLAGLLCSLQLSHKSGRAFVFIPTVTEIWQCCCVHPNCHRNLAGMSCLPQLLARLLQTLQPEARWHQQA